MNSPDVERDRTVDPNEVERYRALAEMWWQPDGRLWPLHVLNRLRSESWTPMLLNVIVKDGRIGLWGFVRSEEERKAARVAAETADGVRPVDDNLIVMRPGLMGA